MTEVNFDPQQFANAYLSAQNFEPEDYESEEDMIKDAFIVYLKALQHASDFVNRQNEEK
ncbi:hypothetical protein K2V61_12350 [Staphylococcus simulans]|uniref:hypothetical protein n=1 Tax=Staphylococcus simulans TaxID=1286 RepID=UPI001E31BC30|nr:hypothetical protein [Staphylococcus simulans]MCD8916330.1 hypothetical protein [Staphylococcus simulans]